MKKYSETRKKPAFDWNQALSAKCQDMPIRELNRLSNMSLSWTTCACGNQCAIIPRDADGEPLDGRLSRLGATFHQHVNEMKNLAKFSGGHRSYESRKSYLSEANKSRNKAIKTLQKIEIRSGQLIEVELKKAQDMLKEFGYKISK